MKSLMILCVLLGYLYTQVEGNTVVTATNESNGNLNVDRQEQLQIYLSKISKITNETRNSVFSTYTADEKFIEYSNTTMEKLFEKVSAQESRDKLLNPSPCVAAKKKISDSFRYFITLNKNILIVCFNNFTKNTNQSEIITRENMEKKNADLNVDESRAMWYETKKSLRMELLEFENIFLHCTSAKLQNSPDKSWVFFKKYLVNACWKTNSDQKPVMESSTNLPYENENGLKDSIKMAQSKLVHIIRKANDSVGQAYHEDHEYIEYRINRINQRIATLNCGEVVKKLTKNMPNIINGERVSAYYLPYEKNDCYDSYMKKTRTELQSFDKDPLELANSMNTPKSEKEWKEFIFVTFHVLERATQITMNNLAASYFKCSKEKSDRLNKIIEVSDRLISSACFRK